MAMMQTLPDGKTGLRRLAEYLVVPQDADARHLAQAKARRARELKTSILEMEDRGPVKEYLWGKGKNERALAQIPFNLKDPLLWDREMDETRKLAGHDKNARAGHFSPKWKHYVISPDPEDKIELSDLMALAFDWCEYFFGNMDSGVKGKLGTFQAMIVFHNDNANQIPHAHIVVNCTNLDNGRRIHIDDLRNQQLSYHLQDLCRERSLRAFPDTPAQAAARLALSHTPEERALLPATQPQRLLLEKLVACGAVREEEIEKLGDEKTWKRGEVSDLISRANERKRKTGTSPKAEGNENRKGDAVCETPAGRKTEISDGRGPLTTRKQRGFVKSLVARGAISREEIARLGGEETWTMRDVNALLNIHSNVAGTLDLGENVVYETRRPSEQAVYMTNSERKIKGRGIYGWKEEIRDAVKIAAAASTSEEGFFAQLFSMGVGVEKKGGDYLYFHPDMNIKTDSTPAERKAASRKVYGRKCGQNFTPRGVRNWQDLAYFRAAWEQGSENSKGFKLIGTFNFDKQTFGNVTIASAADAVGKYGIELLGELVRLNENAGGGYHAKAVDAWEQLEKEAAEDLRWMRDPREREAFVKKFNAKRDKIMAAAADLGMWEYGHGGKEEVDAEVSRSAALRRSGRDKLMRAQTLNAEELKVATVTMKNRHENLIRAQSSDGRSSDDATFWGSRSYSGGHGRSRERSR